METIKTLWYIRKVKVYEALVIKMTNLKNKLKEKQRGYQEKADSYRLKVKERTTLIK
jgi:hypothetical protein